MKKGPSPPPCVFVSAVSSELKAARQLVANCLRVFHNVEVEYQEEFGTESGALLAVLRNMIDRSAGVVQLVGEAFGAAPPDDLEFGPIRPISFTQYEFLYGLKLQEEDENRQTWLIEVTGSCTTAGGG